MRFSKKFMVLVLFFQQLGGFPLARAAGPEPEAAQAIKNDMVNAATPKAEDYFLGQTWNFLSSTAGHVGNFIYQAPGQIFDISKALVGLDDPSDKKTQAIFEIVKKNSDDLQSELLPFYIKTAAKYRDLLSQIDKDLSYYSTNSAEGSKVRALYEKLNNEIAQDPFLQASEPSKEILTLEDFFKALSFRGRDEAWPKLRELWLSLPARSQKALVNFVHEVKGPVIKFNLSLEETYYQMALAEKQFLDQKPDGEAKANYQRIFDTINSTLEEVYTNYIGDLEEFAVNVESAQWAGVLDSDSVLSRYYLPSRNFESAVTQLGQNLKGQIIEIGKSLQTQDDGKVTPLKVRFQLCKSGCDEVLWVELIQKISSKSTTRELEISSSTGYIKANPEVNDFITVLSEGVSAYNENPTEVIDKKNQHATFQFPNEFDRSPIKYVLLNRYASPQYEQGQGHINERQNSVQISGYWTGPLAPRTPSGFTADDSTSAVPLKPGAAFSTQCENFIDRQSNYGSWGLFILEHNTPQRDKFLYGSKEEDIGVPGDLASLDPKLCPNFTKSDFTRALKQNFYVWFAAAIAMEESSCNPRVTARGTYGTAVGLWQLHKEAILNYPTKSEAVCRNSEFNLAGSGPIDPTNGKLNAACGLDMLNGYTHDKFNIFKNSEHRLFHKKNYWQTMHLPQPGAKKALALIRKFIPCYNF